MWPGITAVILLILVRFGLPLLAPDWAIYGFFGGIALGLVTLFWWMFFSRIPHAVRWTAILLLAVALVGTYWILDPSIATGGMGLLYWMYVIPGVAVGLVLCATAYRSLPIGLGRLAMAVFIIGSCAFWAFLRTGGLTGEGSSQLAWRWSKTSEERLLSTPLPEPPPAPPAPVEKPAEPEIRPAALPVMRTPLRRAPRPEAEWPGFRGAHRDDVVTGVRINTDWATSPPQRLWRRAIGPGWSSFAIDRKVFYTQEQRGDFEIVSCYKTETGEPVWVHRDKARFWESNAGAGPRGTPTIHDGKIYSLGATAILNALDADTGRVLWTRNASRDTAAKLPGWGFAGSPIVVSNMLIVAASGRLIAYDLETGEPKWKGPSDIGGGYASPQPMTLGGIEQILLISGAGIISVAPTDGKLLWKHSWPGAGMLQPTLVPDGVLIPNGDAGGGTGTRRLAVSQGPEGWTAKEAWTSQGLKPYFNDIVVHKGHAYGFDGGILSCIDLQDGARKWKGGRYGHGQLILVADQDVLVVLSEEGELALVSATPERFNEIAKIPAIEGKTWNHLAFAAKVLLVRNGEEMAAFRVQ